MSSKLPSSWNTNQDGSGVPAFRRKMQRVLGDHAAALMFDTLRADGSGTEPRWYLVRFLDRQPRSWAGNPSKRSFEVLAQGGSIHELEWALDRLAGGGRVTSYRPVLQKGVGMVGLQSEGIMVPVSAAARPAIETS